MGRRQEGHASTPNHYRDHTHDAKDKDCKGDNCEGTGMARGTVMKQTVAREDRSRTNYHQDNAPRKIQPG